MLFHTVTNICRPILPTYFDVCAKHVHKSQRLGIHTRNKSSLILSSAFRALNLKSDCNREEARDAFVKLAKIYHPDSNSTHADKEKFSLLSEAYNVVISDIKKRNAQTHDYGSDALDDNDFSLEEILKQTIPVAHRRYLTNDGIGFGTPGQRQKQYQAYRMNRANTLVSDYKIRKIQRETEDSQLVTVKDFARRSKTTHFIDRMVEDMIQESMAKGDFKDLKGGKVETPDVPYVDQSDFHLNKVLINNGFSPEWIQTRQQILDSLKKSREMLLYERKRLHRSPNTNLSQSRWKEKQNHFTEAIKSINKEIETYNLITPVLQSQMLLLDSEKELRKIEKQFEDFLKTEEYQNDKERIDRFKSQQEKNTLVDALKDIFFSSTIK